MAINLSKGQRVSLDKGVKLALVGLGWDTNKYDGAADFDLDASAFMLGANGKVRKDEDFIFYGNLSSRNNAVVHQGDEVKGGDGNSDDEQIMIDLSKVPANIEKIDFTVTIYEADVRHQNFGQVENAYIRIVNKDTNEELIRYDLTEDYSVETAVVIGELYRHNGEWKFNAIGQATKDDLQSLIKRYS
jgi:tellurium resistance protein TerD